MSTSRTPVDKILAASGDLHRIAGELEHVQEAFPRRVNADPEKVERGLAQLVLTLVELLRQLMERQALRRMETGTLSDEQLDHLAGVLDDIFHIPGTKIRFGLDPIVGLVPGLGDII